ncbi:cytochrome P450 [Phascolomyces articulosus]|uniref:Cytochrome P450 n=1 Tax=Phascolomyces articulosus TaxID=60185 RepID=A0AAD5P9T6_9FUNG|nr:cytochrome P450 [Phascolomyces articulosus]
MYNLATHPFKIRHEKRFLVLDDQPNDTPPTVEQLKEMTYIQMVIKVVEWNNRTINDDGEDTDIGGCVIPKCALVEVDMMALHNNPKTWINPRIFNPECFAPGGEAESVSKMGSGWVPFSAGARMCIGMNFSLTEQRVFLAMLLKKYELSLPDDSPHKEKLISTPTVGLQKPANLQINLRSAINGHMALLKLMRIDNE